ncbi:hypothetical protein [Archangium sp.]|uniref:hypothetical protein n=1 Tax=Archangium sp. TaxID=1872627 RepID=UPI00389B2782
MADTGFFKGWLGPFKLVKRYTHRRLVPGIPEVGRVYEARHVLTENPALVVIPGERAPVEPLEEWRVRLRAQAFPPYFSLEVEQAPESGRLYQLRGMLELLGSAIAGLVYQDEDEARAHLTSRPMGFLEAIRRDRRFRLAVIGYVVLVVCGVSVHLFFRFHVAERAGDIPDVGNEKLVHEAAESSASVLANEAAVDPGPIAYPLPQKPFSNQAKAPCVPNEGEVEINGGCWIALEKRPPCHDKQAEYRGKCYLPVAASSRNTREPRSLRR